MLATIKDIGENGSKNLGEGVIPPPQTSTADYLQGSISKLLLAVAVPILFVTFKG
jgi:hypothetical protein